MEINNSIGIRLKESRERLGKTQSEFAEIAADFGAPGVTRQSQAKYEKGLATPNAAYLAGIAATGVDVLYILTGIDANAHKRLATLGQAMELASAHAETFKEQKALGTALNDQMRDEKYLKEYLFVPRYDVRASAGGGSIISDESVVDHLAFKREWITQSLGCQPDKICVIQVRGDSMTPTINDADLLLLDLRLVSQKSEGVYVIQNEGSLLVKRLRFKLDGAVEIISDNARYGTETLTGKRAEQLAVLGRVVWHGKKF